MQEKVAGIIDRLPLFRGLNKEEIRQLLLREASQVLHFQKGMRVFSEEDKPDKLFILCEGRVAVGKHTSRGKRLLLTTIEEPGDMFGEIYAFAHLPAYELFAEAEADSVVLALHRSLFQLDSKSNQDKVAQMVMQNLLQIFATKALHLNARLQIVIGGSLREKIARYLISQERSKPQTCLRNREELADFLGVTRPSLSRELSKMAQEGLIDISGRMIRVLDSEQLEKYL